MFTVPLGVYFGTRVLLVDELRVEEPYSFLVPTLLAVAAVNLVILLFVRQAFKEARREEQSRVDAGSDHKKEH